MLYNKEILLTKTAMKLAGVDYRKYRNLTKRNQEKKCLGNTGTQLSAYGNMGLPHLKQNS